MLRSILPCIWIMIKSIGRAQQWKLGRKFPYMKLENNYSFFPCIKILQANSLLIQHLSPFNLVFPLVDRITQLKGFYFELSVSEVKMVWALWKIRSLLVPYRHVWIVHCGLLTLSISGTAAPMKVFLLLAHSQGEPRSNTANYVSLLHWGTTVLKASFLS